MNTIMYVEAFFIATFATSMILYSGDNVKPGASDKIEIICSEAASQYEMNKCSLERFKSAEKEMESVFSELKKHLNVSETKDISFAQKKWEEYRDATCLFKASKSKGGTAYPMVLILCRTDMTRERTTQLKTTLDGIVQATGDLSY